MNEEWGTPISKDKIIYRRNKLIELAKVEAKPYTIWHETINENILDINYMIYEIERLHSIINKYVEDMEDYLDSNPPVDVQDYTHRVRDIEYLEKGIEELKFITTIREKLKELKGSDKE